MRNCPLSSAAANATVGVASLGSPGRIRAIIGETFSSTGGSHVWRVSKAALPKPTPKTNGAAIFNQRQERSGLICKNCGAGRSSNFGSGSAASSWGGAACATS